VQEAGLLAGGAVAAVDELADLAILIAPVVGGRWIVREGEVDDVASCTAVAGTCVGASLGGEV